VQEALAVFAAGLVVAMIVAAFALKGSRE
jgi:hypothetical protein